MNPFDRTPQLSFCIYVSISLTHGKQEGEISKQTLLLSSFQIFGCDRSFCYFAKKREGILRQSSEGLTMCWFNHCIYHDIQCAVLAVLIGYWSCANTCITLGHHRIDNQASLTLRLSGVCFYILFVEKQLSQVSLVAMHLNDGWFPSGSDEKDPNELSSTFYLLSDFQDGW